MELVRVNKQELVIPVNNGDGRSDGDVIRVENVTGDDVAVKMESSNSNLYIIRPNEAYITKGTSLDILVSLSEDAIQPSSGPSADELRLHVAPATGLSAKRRAWDFWRAFGGSSRQLIRLSVRFVPHSSVRGGDTEALHVSPHTKEIEMSCAPHVFPYAGETEACCAPRERANAIEDGDLVCVDKSELAIPIDVGTDDERGAIICVANISDENVAFKMKLTNPNRYIVRPKDGCIAKCTSINIRIMLDEYAEQPKPGTTFDLFQLRVAPAPGISDASYFWRSYVESSDMQNIRLSARLVPLPDATFSAPPEDASRARAIVNGDYVYVNKREVAMPMERGTSGIMHVENISGEDIIYKMKTTNAHQYAVSPNMACISKGTSVDIRFLYSYKPVKPEPGPSKDKFLLCVALASTMHENLPLADFWRYNEKMINVQRFKFSVNFVPRMSVV